MGINIGSNWLNNISIWSNSVGWVYVGDNRVRPVELVVEYNLTINSTPIYKSGYIIKSVELQYEATNNTSAWNDWWIVCWGYNWTNWNTWQIAAHIPAWAQWWYKYADMNQYWWIYTKYDNSWNENEIYIAGFTSTATTNQKWAMRVIFNRDSVEYYVWQTYWNRLLHNTAAYSSTWSTRVNTLFNNSAIDCTCNWHNVTISRRKAVVTYTPA